MKEEDFLQNNSNETKNKFHNPFEDFNKNIDDIYTNHTKDNDIENKEISLNYFNYIAQNIKENNSRMVKNSFGMLICFLMYFLIDGNKTDEVIEILFIKIKDKTVLFSFIPICFSFLFFKNIAIFSNNRFLNLLFEKISEKIYSLGKYSNTKNFIKPFFFTESIIANQLKNHELKSSQKFPLKTTVIIGFVIFPLVFIFYSIYRIFIDNYMSFTPIVSVILIFISLFGTIIHLQAIDKKIREYEAMLTNDEN